ncbi:MAG TPA: phosphotransferase [Pyrinomonadaceae bacterium]|nr:phosphotransferase [Pyrinomonadaceae bacterium]
MQLLDHTPAFDVEAAAAIAVEHFGVYARAQALPSERDQNFLLTSQTGEKFVLKIANALESREFLDAQNSVLRYLERHVAFCQKLRRTGSGEDVVAVNAANGTMHYVRMVHYLPGVPLAEVRPHTPGLLHDLGRKLGQLAHALADFDHPAVHRDFHWDLANGNRVVNEFAGLIENASLREIVLKCRYEPPESLRRSVIHGDANDYNLLVDPESLTISGLIDFGDMVYSYTVGDLAIAIAYVILDKSDPAEIVRGYRSEFALLDEELEALWPLVRLRLAMSVCMAAHQLRLQPENKYLSISQKAIEETLPRIYADENGFS